MVLIIWRKLFNYFSNSQSTLRQEKVESDWINGPSCWTKMTEYVHFFMVPGYTRDFRRLVTYQIPSLFNLTWAIYVFLQSRF